MLWNMCRFEMQESRSRRICRIVKAAAYILLAIAFIEPLLVVVHALQWGWLNAAIDTWFSFSTYGTWWIYYHASPFYPFPFFGFAYIPLFGIAIAFLDFPSEDRTAGKMLFLFNRFLMVIGLYITLFVLSFVSAIISFFMEGFGPGTF